MISSFSFFVFEKNIWDFQRPPIRLSPVRTPICEGSNSPTLAGWSVNDTLRMDGT